MSAEFTTRYRIVVITVFFKILSFLCKGTHLQMSEMQLRRGNISTESATNRDIFLLSSSGYARIAEGR